MTGALLLYTGEGGADQHLLVRVAVQTKEADLTSKSAVIEPAPEVPKPKFPLLEDYDAKDLGSCGISHGCNGCSGRYLSLGTDRCIRKRVGLILHLFQWQRYIPKPVGGFGRTLRSKAHCPSAGRLRGLLLLQP